jgi:hypothetical protein
MSQESSEFFPAFNFSWSEAHERFKRLRVFHAQPFSSFSRIYLVNLRWAGMCFRMRISQNSHAMRKFCEISHSHRIAEPISDSHNFRKMRTKFSHAKNSHYAKLSPNATFRMRIFWKCEFMRNANFCDVRIFAKCEFMRNANFREVRISAKCEFMRNANFRFRFFAKCEFQNLYF